MICVTGSASDWGGIGVFVTCDENSHPVDPLPKHRFFFEASNPSVEALAARHQELVRFAEVRRRNVFSCNRTGSGALVLNAAFDGRD